MVQAVNTKAILTLASVIRRPSLLVPHVSVDHISQIDFLAMQKYAGIQAIIFDKDNTLTAPYAQNTHPLAQFGLQQAINIFGKDHVAILSNSAGTTSDDGPDFYQAKTIEASLGIAVIRHTEKKPGGLNDVLKHFNLINSESSNENGNPASRICIIGDRLLTDVVFGNLHGMLTIHTLPLLRDVHDNIKVDNWTASLIRPIENTILYKSSLGRRLRPPPHAYWKGPEIHSLKLPSSK